MFHNLNERTSWIDNRTARHGSGDGTPSRRLTRKEEEDLFSAIIHSYLKDEIDLEIYPKGISIREKSNPSSHEVFFPFEEET